MNKLLYGAVAVFLFSSLAISGDSEQAGRNGEAVPVTGRVCFSADPARQIAAADATLGSDAGEAVFKYYEKMSRCVYARGAEVKFTGVSDPISGRLGTVVVFEGMMYFKMSDFTRQVYVLPDLPVREIYCPTDLPPRNACT